MYACVHVYVYRVCVCVNVGEIHVKWYTSVCMYRGVSLYVRDVTVYCMLVIL